MPKRCVFGRCFKSTTEKKSLFKITQSRFEAWKDNMPGLILNKFICTKHFRDEDIIKGWESGGISFQYVTPRLKDTAIPFHTETKDDDTENVEHYKMKSRIKRLKSDVISQKFCDSGQSTTAKQNKIRPTQKNLDLYLEESEINIKEELQSDDEIEIKYNPIDIHQEFKLEFSTQEPEILTNIKTEPSDLNLYSVYEKDIKIEPSDTETQSENILQPLTSEILLYSVKSETFLDGDEDPLKMLYN